MINFFSNNYEWFFSGIGVLIISALYGFFNIKKPKPSRTIEVKNIKIKDSSNTNIQIANNLVNNNIVVESVIESEIVYNNKPIDIINTIYDAPPFRRIHWNQVLLDYV